MKYNKEDHRNRNRPVEGKRSMKKIKRKADGRKGRKVWGGKKIMRH